MSSSHFKIFIMNEMTKDPAGLRPAIPESAYRPVKRCPNCQSVYLTDTNCEACGRSLLYHPIGEPFSAKSLYGFKERYAEALPTIVKYCPVFEDKNSNLAKSYLRNLTKRFDDLLEAFGIPDAISSDNRRFFYVEMLELMDELLRFGVIPFILQQKFEARIMETGPLLTQEFLLYLAESQKENDIGPTLKDVIFEHRVGGMRVEYILKVALITATVLIVAVSYYGLVSSQLGK
jgi:hypothetical protein